MKRRGRTAHFISAAGSGGGIPGWTQPDINWEWWNQVPVNSPGGYLPPAGGSVEVTPPGNAQQIVGFMGDGTPIFSTTAIGLRDVAPGEQVTEVGVGSLGGKLYKDAQGNMFQTPVQTMTEIPGGQDPTMEGETPIFSTDVSEKGDWPGIKPEVPTPDPITGGPIWRPPPSVPQYQKDWWVEEPPQLPWEPTDYNPFPPPGYEPDPLYKFQTTVTKPQDREPIPDPIDGHITWRPPPAIPPFQPWVIEEPPIIQPPPFVSTKPPAKPPQGPTYGWDPPTEPPPPPKPTEKPGGGGGGTEKPKPKEEEKVKPPVLPYVAPGAPNPGAFAPMVGPQGYQSIFGGPLVSREPQYAPMLNMLLRGIGR